ncbi:MAG: tagaturonate reductase [Bacteroidia bacterium]|nr:tagaturonate reductase [Bacteroidia bacterium]
MELKNITQIHAKRNSYPIKIIQFGEGNFLRAFADWIIDSMNKTLPFNAGVAVVQPIEQGMVEKLKEQDGLYTVYLTGIKGGEAIKEHFLIDCISQLNNPYQNFSEYLSLAQNPDVRLVISNTTEAGIRFDDQDRPDDQPPGSFPAKLTVLLYHRYQYFKGSADKGLILLPCELINHNGTQLKDTVLKYVQWWNLEEGFANWLHQHNIFCNTLVDRIVPGFPRDTIAEIQNELGYKDHFVVEGELFHLWVIEAPQSVQKEFPAPEAGLNVVFTDNLQPYRTRKVRILNGAHTAMVPVGLLWGIETVKEAIEHEKVGRFISQAIFEEILPVLPLPQPELEQFAQDVIDRFRNPFIKHYLSSIALNAFSKFETRVLPTIFEYQKLTGKLPKRLIFSFASLILFYKKNYEDREMPIQDDVYVVETLQNAWQQYDYSEASIAAIVETALGMEDVWKQNLNTHEALKDAIFTQLVDILTHGLENAWDLF